MRRNHLISRLVAGFCLFVALVACAEDASLNQSPTENTIESESPYSEEIEREESGNDGLERDSSQIEYGLPDLQISEYEWVASVDEENVRSLTIAAELHNYGTSSAENVQVLIQLSGTNWQEIVTIEDIAPDESQAVTVSFGADPGTYLLDVVADPENLIEETYDDNNSVETVIEFK